MIVEDIDQNPLVMTIGIIDASLAPHEEAITGGKGIDLAVQRDPSPNFGWITIIQPPLDEIAHHVADQGFPVLTGQKKMHQVIDAAPPDKKWMKTPEFSVLSGPHF
jgi:hypothetical protein